ncbi:hypothetical protein [Brachyspira hampsonii]|uniref:hypothetical protein n=1 Tax=Brachyspira hampsonii TaxID=1287055 RepID=UPI000D3622DF|nr:hypothetical protein [Brachyspira hampsonii]PTY41017.1 hypothetical protein DQ06_10910 [Brachyspira hampsonii bv. II]
MKKVIDFIIHTIVVTLVSIILLIFILPNLKFLNLGNILNNETFDVSDVIGMLSLNLGILQGLMALFGMGIAAVAFVNFTQIRNKLEELEDKINKPSDVKSFEVDKNSKKEKEKDIIEDFETNKNLKSEKEIDTKNIEK